MKYIFSFFILCTLFFFSSCVEKPLHTNIYDPKTPNEKPLNIRLVADSAIAAVSAGSITIQWPYCASVDEEDFDKYLIYKSINGIIVDSPFISISSYFTTYFVDRQVLANTEYTYGVKVLDKGGKTSEMSIVKVKSAPLIKVAAVLPNDMLLKGATMNSNDDSLYYYALLKSSSLGLTFLKKISFSLDAENVIESSISTKDMPIERYLIGKSIFGQTSINSIGPLMNSLYDIMVDSLFGNFLYFDSVFSGNLDTAIKMDLIYDYGIDFNGIAVKNDTVFIGFDFFFMQDFKKLPSLKDSVLVCKTIPFVGEQCIMTPVEFLFNQYQTATYPNGMPTTYGLRGILSIVPTNVDGEYILDYSTTIYPEKWQKGQEILDIALADSGNGFYIYTKGNDAFDKFKGLVYWKPSMGLDSTIKISNITRDNISIFSKFNGSEDRVYLASESGVDIFSISKVSKTIKKLKSIHSKELIQSPQSLYVDNNYNHYLIDEGVSGLVVFDSTGTPISRWTSIRNKSLEFSFYDFVVGTKDKVFFNTSSLLWRGDL